MESFGNIWVIGNIIQGRGNNLDQDLGCFMTTSQGISDAYHGITAASIYRTYSIVHALLGGRGETDTGKLRMGTKKLLIQRFWLPPLHQYTGVGGTGSIPNLCHFRVTVSVGTRLFSIAFNRNVQVIRLLRDVLQARRNELVKRFLGMHVFVTGQ